MVDARPRGAKPATGLLTSPSGRRALFATLYFVEGAPIGFVWWTLPALLGLEGVAVERVTALTGLLVLPWALKFVWAPLVDLATGPRFTLRGWILAAQIVMVTALVPLAFVRLEAELPLVTALLSLHAFAAATQDVAIDALAIRTVPEAERGALNGWMQVGMLVGRGLFGGAVLFLHEPGRTGPLVWALVGALSCAMLVHAFYRAPLAPDRPTPAAYLTVLGRVARLRTTWVALAFAASGGAAFELVGALAGTYLVARGHGERAIGLFYALAAVLCLASGALLGGWLSDRLGRVRAVAWAGAALALAVGVLAALPTSDASDWAGLSAIYLLAGVFTAASYTLFMALTDRRLSAVQFSAAMGATNLCEAWSARLGGLVAGRHGYPHAFGLGALLGAVALLLLLPIRIPGAAERPPR